MNWPCEPPTAANGHEMTVPSPPYYYYYCEVKYCLFHSITPSVHADFVVLQLFGHHCPTPFLSGSLAPLKSACSLLLAYNETIIIYIYYSLL